MKSTLPTTIKEFYTLVAFQIDKHHRIKIAIMKWVYSNCFWKAWSASTKRSFFLQPTESDKNNLQMKSIHEYDAEANGSTSNPHKNEPQLTGFESSKTDLTDGEKIGKTESNNNISEDGQVKNGGIGVVNETFKDDENDSSNTSDDDKEKSNLPNDEKD